MREHTIDFASCYGALDDYEAVCFESFNLLFEPSLIFLVLTF
jgi:hypothetical protein